jgi:sigma-B regulation protein RsbU (phosphoserine phosphatase)
MGILVVDDSPVNLTFFQNELMAAGYTKLYLARSASEAFDILGMSNNEGVLRKGPPIDLILMDIEMPGMNGIEACRLIKSRGHYSDLPIIFVTASKRHLDTAFSAGGMDFIEKSCERLELLARVKSALSLKREMDERKSRESKMLREFQLAKHIQRSVLTPPIVNSHIHIHSIYKQSDEVSGDMLYWSQIDHHRYGIILIDVAGHGLSSALISMSIRALLSGLIKQGIDPDQLYAELNQQMHQLFSNGKRLIYFTSIYVVIDTRQQTIEYFNAGHPPGLLIHRNKVVQRLEGTCVPVGVKATPPCRTRCISYEDGARLILYTDGLIETKGQPLSGGIMQLESQAIRLHASENARFIENIVDLKKEINDDICVISIELIRAST